MYVAFTSFIVWHRKKQTWAYPTKFNEMVGHNKGKTPDVCHGLSQMTLLRQCWPCLL